MTAERTDIRPKDFSEFIGNTAAVAVLQTSIKAAQKRSEGAIGHTLILGPPGHGKTSLARLMASEFGGGAKLREVLASNVSSPEQLTGLLADVGPGDILFIDEIHLLSRSRGCEEALYSAMEDGIIPIINSAHSDMMANLGLGGSQTTRIEYRMPPFCLVGASTLAGQISNPLRSRFIQEIHLESYTLEDLQAIAYSVARKLAFPISKKVAMEIGRRSKLSARNAVNLVRWFRDFGLANDLNPTLASLEEAMSVRGISSDGLNAQDRKLLAALVEGDGKPIGLDSLACSLNESEDSIKAMEVYLVQAGYIRRTGRGRIALEKAYALMNRPAKLRRVA